MMQLQQLLSTLEGKNKDKKIIYPDISDEKVCEAVSILLELGDTPVICGTETELEQYQKLIAQGLECYEVNKGENNETYAAELLAEGKVDGFLGGNISTTSDIVRALIKNVGSLEGISRISSHFLMGREDELLIFSDAGIQLDPNPQQLAEIAFLSIRSAIKYGIEPRVALLSFSTAGSGGESERVLKVRHATQILRDMLSKEGIQDIPVEGELQFDAAFIPEIGKRKNPQTSLIESANVFIFPDLDSANIAYKITQRLAGFTALGPVIQGLAKPGNDLSRGCSVEDIIAMHHITKNQ